MSTLPQFAAVCAANRSTYCCLGVGMHACSWRVHAESAATMGWLFGSEPWRLPPTHIYFLSAFFHLVKPWVTKWRQRDTALRTLSGGQSSNLVVNDVRLNQHCKVLALEGRARWDVTINPWPLAQWCTCLGVPAWNSRDLLVRLRAKHHYVWVYTPSCDSVGHFSHYFAVFGSETGFAFNVATTVIYKTTLKNSQATLFAAWSACLKNNSRTVSLFYPDVL